MKYVFAFLFVFFALVSSAQSEYHVFPIDGKDKQGSPHGDGSVDKPWDLQTALSQPSKRVNGDDIIWLHQGTYNGRFQSTLESTNLKFITVSAYKTDKVVLNGNIRNELKAVLEVKGNQVVFKNFEVTFLGEYSRNAQDDNFKVCAGINHLSGVSKFQNLKIYNNPGLGFGSWKNTGGSVIEECMIYYNGVLGKKRGSGEGIYIQNNSEDHRIIINNIIYGNYYKGIEVWSASSGKKQDFVKNISLVNNIIFNNGTPSGRHWGNVIVATNDKEGINIARNIKVKGNVLYHNVDLINHKKLGNASSLALGFIKRAPVKNVEVANNVIIGQNNGFSIMHAESLIFKNNIVYTGYIHLEKSTQSFLKPKAFKMEDNIYYTKKPKAFRIIKNKDYNLLGWQTIFNIDKTSQWKWLKDFKIDPVLKIVELKTEKDQFYVALLDKEANDVTVDFSAFNIEAGAAYKIYDIENRNVVAKPGKMPKNMKISFPMGLKAFEKPLHNSIAAKSADNFGVYRIVFEKQEKKKSFLERFFGWLF
ncbi:hypothetical protein [uncultured Winogradskyella sp.]|uniref:hypothetical protein n=1 Tax=uncultured Winogradskyella sp. TaxID=395353 RepID=UPI00260E8DE1|nr:hypothetical protein [uncultured Winogradskyella sp.]